MWDTIIINPFTNALLFIYSLVGNMGIAIILFTLLIRLVTHPLMVSQIKGSQGLQALQTDKRWIDAQAKYKNDKEKLAQEQMALYKELGVNPLASCLPTLIQFPIIIGLYQSLVTAVATTPLELFKLSNILYPGFLQPSSIFPLNVQFLWMNMGQPEKLFLPFLPSFGIPVLAILVVITSYVQAKLTMPPPTGDPKSQSASMGNMMTIYMPLLMGWISITAASGLALYFFVGNVIGIAQYAILGKLNWSNLFPSRKPVEKKKGSK